MVNENNLVLRYEEKNILLYEELYDRYSRTGDYVCDLFVGTGTSAAAAINLKRKYIGSEIDAEVFKHACKRIYDCAKHLLTTSNIIV